MPAKKELTHEGHHLVSGQIDAHGFCCHFVIPDGLEGTAVGGVDQQHDQGDAYAGHQIVGHGGVEVPGTRRKHVGAVGEGAQLIPLEDSTDDLRKAQRGDGQVVALQAQDGQADEPGEQSCHQAAQDQGDEHSHNGTGTGSAEDVRQRKFHPVFPAEHPIDALTGGFGNHNDGVGISAQQHEARLPQREQAGEAVEQVHGDGHQRIDGSLFSAP